MSGRRPSASGFDLDYEGYWRKVSDSEWFGASFGTVSKRADGWWGSNSTRADVDVEPIVGPFPKAKDARMALGHAMTRWRDAQARERAAQRQDHG